MHSLYSSTVVGFVGRIDYKKIYLVYFMCISFFKNMTLTFIQSKNKRTIFIKQIRFTKIKIYIKITNIYNLFLKIAKCLHTLLNIFYISLLLIFKNNLTIYDTAT